MASAFKAAAAALLQPASQSTKRPNTNASALDNLPSERDGWLAGPAVCSRTLCLSIVVLGASGDLAKKAGVAHLDDHLQCVQ